MSHFSLAVFHKHDNLNDIEELLAPYCEDINFCPAECASFEVDPDGPDFHPDTGEKGYYFNPQAKWDWFDVGGRFGNMLRLKPDATGRVGMGWRTCRSIDDITPVMVDSAKVKDIDWAYHLSEQPSISYRAARANYLFGTAAFDIQYPSEATYNAINRGFSTYAVLTADGKWCGVGDMWWFGLDNSLVDDRVNFVTNYYENFIKPAIEQDLYITIVDCHI